MDTLNFELADLIDAQMDILQRHGIHETTDLAYTKLPLPAQKQWLELQKSKDQILNEMIRNSFRKMASG